MLATAGGILLAIALVVVAVAAYLHARALFVGLCILFLVAVTLASCLGG